jgi:glycosyltransferase involved in cell wall biosynthesis
MKKISVLINTYNYGRFVVEAVESVLAQTLPATEIIVVDDGSTDDTAALLATKFSRQPQVKIVAQRNGGQLSAFVTGFEQAMGDYIFMLDADDTYAPEHLATMVRGFEAHPEADFIFSAHRQFGDASAVVQLAPQDRALGFSVVGAMARTLWVGSVTSTLALRRSLMLLLLPSLRTLVPRWRIRADDCLVLGSSLAGSQKYYLATPTVNYRVHGQNHFHRQAIQTAGDYAHWLRRESLKVVLAAQLGIPADIANQVDTEFACLPAPTARDLEEYSAIARELRLPFWSRWKKRLKLQRHFKCQRAASPTTDNA